jgi:DNA-binding SARP family transcriptional activator
MMPTTRRPDTAENKYGGESLMAADPPYPTVERPHEGLGVTRKETHRKIEGLTDHVLGESNVEFGILGPLEVKRAAVIVPVEGRRQRRLLAILLLNRGSVVPVDQLIQQLWEQPPPSARQQVHNAVARLRRGLAAPAKPDVVQTTDIGYRTQVGDEQLDAHRFATGVRAAERAVAQGRPDDAVQQLGSALALWRGPALAGLDGDLITSAGTRLDEQRLGATERLLTLRSERGEYGVVLGELTELLARHPLRDSLRALLMLTHYRAGRRHDALQVYETGRQLLADELGLDPSPELSDLHQRVLRGDSDLLPRTSVHHCAGARPRSFLPHAPRVFVGRTREIEQIVTEARRPTTAGPVVLSINGMGGVGKTSLALRAAHRLADSYPDGQFFVDLHGFSRHREPVVAAAALEMLLRVAGFPSEQIHPNLDGRAAQWRSHLTGGRVLIVLDDASDEAQVRPLVPGTGGSVVMVTSRRRLVGIEDVVPISLDVLPVDEAVTLLGRIAGRPTPDDGSAVAVVESCGQLPLAVRVAASRLLHYATWSAEQLAVLLGDERQRRRLLTAGDQDVFGELAMSYQRLTDDQRGFFRTLAAHPRAGFDRQAAAVTAGLSSIETEQRLDELVEANLVEHRPIQRYRVPGLLYDVARNLSLEHGTGNSRQPLPV